MRLFFSILVLILLGACRRIFALMALVNGPWARQLLGLPS